MDDQQLETAPPRPAPVDRAPVLQRCLAIARRPDRLRQHFATAAARFVASAGPHWLGCYNQAHYAADHLGMTAATFRNYVAVGRLLGQLPSAADHLSSGRVTWSALVELARAGELQRMQALLPAIAGLPVAAVAQLVDACRDHGPESPAQQAPPPLDNPDLPMAAPAASAHPSQPVASTLHLSPTQEDALVNLTLTLPAPVAAYATTTLDAASLLLGHDAPCDQQLEAVVAEASTEIAVTVDPESACRRFGVRWPLPAGHPVHVGMRQPSIAAARQASASGCAAPGSAAPGSAAQAPAAGRGPAAWKLDAVHPSRRDALRLHRFLLRQARRLATAQADLQDDILVLIEHDVPRTLGLPNIETFAAQVLGLPRRTVFEYLHRARRRRRDDPVATALAGGRIGEVHADLLERLARTAGVPRRALRPWIDAAAQMTVRGLRDRVRWARLQTATDYRAWSLADFPVPDDQQVRTSALQLARCLRDATPPDPAALLQAKHLPQIRFSLTARTSDLVVLLQIMASLQDAAVHQQEHDTGVPASRPPLWWAALAVFTLARRAWTQHAAANHHPSHRVLDRDAYRCAAPGCPSRRNLESHHVRYKSHLGPDDSDNRAGLCATHHRLGEHGGILRVRGVAIPDASVLRWEMGLDAKGRGQAIYRGDTLLWRAGRAGHASRAGHANRAGQAGQASQRGSFTQPAHPPPPTYDPSPQKPSKVLWP